MARVSHKIIFSGQEGSGKSLRMAYLARQVVKNNAKYFKITKLARPIYTNVRFSDKFKSQAFNQGIKIYEWDKLTDLVGLSGCDIFIDEIGTFFDARAWPDLPIEVRRWVSQCQKNGVNLFGTAQDFGQIDKSFRKLVDKLFSVQKIVGSRRPHITYPPIKYPFGLFMIRSLDPRMYKADESSLETVGIPSFFLLDKDDYSIYSTNQSIEMPLTFPLTHKIKECGTCGFSKVVHV